MTDDQLPAHILNYAGDSASDDIVAGLGVTSPPYISIMSSRFTMIDAAGNKRPVPTFDQKIGPYVDVVILAGNREASQIYYADEFPSGANEFAPPDCWSDNGTGPSVNCTSPQWPTCATCPKRMWDSDVSKVTGKGVPACSLYKKIAVLLADEKIAGDMVFLIRVPPASLKGLRAYTKLVRETQVNGKPLSLTRIITRIWFDTGPSGTRVGTLGFRGVAYIDADTSDTVEDLLKNTAALDNLLGRNDRARDPATIHVGHQTVGSSPEPTLPPGVAPWPPVAGGGGAQGSWLGSGGGVAASQTAAASQQNPETGQTSKRGRKPGSRNKPKEDTGSAGGTGIATQISPPMNAGPVQPPFGQPVQQTAPAGSPSPNPQVVPGGIQTNAPAPDAMITEQLNALFKGQ